VSLPNFVTPHCHIQSLDSASTPAAFADRELELGTGALTVTDHGSLAACQTVYDLARKKKLTPILGLEGYFRDDDCPIILGAGFQKNAAGKLVDTLKYAHFTTHFLNQNAFKTAIKLLSHAPIERHGSEQKPLFNWTAMEELGAADATITTGCLIGMVQRHLLDRQDPAMAEAYFHRLRGMVKPGNLYVEVFPHICSHNWVAGVFLTLREKDGEPFKLRFYGARTCAPTSVS
jgi:DNA polymerase-3 subunit alpha